MNTLGTFDRAVEGWQREVDSEAAQLVRDGVEPFEAMRRAKEIVSNRRREQSRARTLEEKLGANPIKE